MRVIGILLLSLVLNWRLNAQSNLEAEIVGSWIVVKVLDMGPIPTEQKEKVEAAKKAFLESKFHFKPDGKFSFDFSLDEMGMANEHWKIPKGTSRVVIQEWEDKDKERPILMGITVLSKDEKIIFVLEEIVALEVKKE